MSAERIKVGPFTWQHSRARLAHDAWDLVNPAGDDKGTVVSFCVKSYDGHQWELVSGGPFRAAGVYASARGAMEGVIPWLLSYLTVSIDRKRAELQAQIDALAVFEAEIGQ